MPSANAAPISGSELVKFIQGDWAVWLNRNQFAQLVAASPLYSKRPFYRPTALTGSEQFEALQDGTRITMTPADLTAWLVGTAPIPKAPGVQAGPITGSEVASALQAAYHVGLNLADVLTVRSGGGPVTDLAPGSGGGGAPSPGVITFDPIVTRSGNVYTFTARRTANLSNAETRQITVTGSTAYPPGATAADFGGAFPTTTASFAAGSAIAPVAITSPIAQPE